MNGFPHALTSFTTVFRFWFFVKTGSTGFPACAEIMAGNAPLHEEFARFYNLKPET
jgi:hypothetical protein